MQQPDLRALRKGGPQPPVEPRTFTDEMIDIIRPQKPGNRAERRATKRAVQDWVLRERCFAALGDRRFGDHSTAFLLAHVNRLAHDRNKRAIALNLKYRRAYVRALRALKAADADLSTG